MKNRKTLRRIGITIVVVGAAVFYFYINPRLAAQKIEFTYTSLDRGDIETSISSTGTLEAVNTVEVGTQISGTISKIYVDYNSKVRAGQLLAEMDTKLLNASLQNAQANLSVMETRLRQTHDDFQRNKALYEKKVITEKEFMDSKYTYEQALSNRNATEASVRSMKVNLNYARITSPIDGTVTERSVEQGQTVAASFSTPTMFIIAEDLSKMQILADVDESDIGAIKKDMQVRFRVQAYPEKFFYGKVTQIRLQPIEVNNVVNYKVEVSVNNNLELLLPGMTTNLDFISGTSHGVIRVSNSALRFRPNDIMLKQIKPQLKEKAKNLPDSLRERFLNSIENEELFSPANFKKTLPPIINGLFYQNDKRKLEFDFVELGITTGLYSEIKTFLDGTPLTEGAMVINGIKIK